MTFTAAAGVLSNDADADGDTLTATVVDSPRWGELELASNGGFAFTPARDSSGVVTFRYAAFDGLLSDTATVTITIAPRADAPVAVADAYQVGEDDVLTVLAATGVLSNDADADGDALTASVVDSPRWGELELASNGSFTFAPARDSSGVVTFRYAASDGTLADTATVTITVGTERRAGCRRRRVRRHGRRGADLYRRGWRARQ